MKSVLSYPHAKTIAIEVYNRLVPFCDKIHIAGSVRREREVVGDIEMVCLPKYVNYGKQMDMFSTTVTPDVVSREFCDEVNQLGKVVKGKPDGRMMQILLPAGIMLDLFMPQPHDYFRQLAMRTGSSDYSHKVIAAGWNKIGWCGTPDGLRLIKECKQVQYNDGALVKFKWVCEKENPTLPPIWTSEEHFFTWLGIQYLLPRMRNL